MATLARVKQSFCVPSPRRLPTLRTGLLLGCAVGCGSRTGLDAPTVDTGVDAGLPAPLQPIDPACTGGGPVASVYTLVSDRVGGAAAITLDVDFATYLEADGILIGGQNADGSSYTLMDSCRLQTWSSGDPTGGRSRPPDQTIRQFHISVPAGTTQLEFNFGGVVSPMYLQVLGLCDFTVTPFPDAVWWQAVP